jgi:hypothetical protein
MDGKKKTVAYSGRKSVSKYAEIRKFVQRHHGFVPKTGWIAHVEKVRGWAPKRTRRSPRSEPCPAEKREAIEEAFRHLRLK